MVEPEGGGGGGGGGDVTLLSARNEERFLLSFLSSESKTAETEGLSPERECLFFKGRGKRSGEWVTSDDMV